MFHLSKRSIKNMEGIDPKLIRIAKLAITLTKIDFGIPNDGGYRTASDQNVIYKRGNSGLDGYKKISYHQSGRALDFYGYANGKLSYDDFRLAMIAASFLQAASILGYKLEWGGLWKKGDMPHVQLKKRTKLISKFNRLFKRRL